MSASEFRSPAVPMLRLVGAILVVSLMSASLSSAKDAVDGFTELDLSWATFTDVSSKTFEALNPDSAICGAGANKLYTLYLQTGNSNDPMTTFLFSCGADLYLEYTWISGLPKAPQPPTTNGGNGGNDDKNCTASNGFVVLYSVAKPSK